MFRVFDGRTANEVWTMIAQSCQSIEAAELRVSRAGQILDLENVCLTITDPRQRWVVSREPALNPAFAIAEVVWIMNGRSDAAFLNYFNRQLPRFAGNVEEYPGAYGYRLRHNMGIDQLDRAYSALSRNSHTRQVVLQIWDGKRDLPGNDGSPSSSDVPCNIVSLLKVRHGRLDWTQVLRSNDLFLGLPHNIVQFTSIHEILAGWLGVTCGHFHLMTDCLHVYESDLQHIGSSKSLVAQENTDVFTCGRVDSDKYFSILAECIESIIDDDISAEEILRLIEVVDLPSEYRNMLFVVAAEGLRRRNAVLLFDVLRQCTNGAYIQMWDRWITRMRINVEKELHRVIGEAVNPVD